MKNEILCIFCMKEKSPSEEHIFPDSLGGLLITFDVCKTCNDYLGRQVDSPLINHYIMKLIRIKYKLIGKKGNLPNPFAKGQLDDGTKVHYLMDKNGQPRKLYSLPKKELVSKLGERKTIKFSVDVDDEDKLYKMVNAELKRSNLPTMTRDKFKNSTKRITNTNPKMNVQVEMSLVDWHRAILKIIYECTYYVLGKEYLLDPIAENFRKLILNIIEPKSANLQGTIDINSPEKNDKNDILSKFSTEHSMTTVIFRSNNLISCYVNLFNIFVGNFIVSITGEKYSIKNNDGLVFVNDVEKKTLNKLRFFEAINKLNK